MTVTEDVPVPLAPSEALKELRETDRQFRAWARRRDELITQCIRLNLSERAIGYAASVTGPAISYRKKKLRESE